MDQYKNEEFLYGLVVAPTANIGDDIQSLAAKQHLPRVDVYLDRESLHDLKIPKHKKSKPIKVILNGWFMHKPENWPPAANIHPLFVSFHINPLAYKKMLNRKGIEYLKKFEPIGARDIYTQQILEENGIESYFSGCLTLTLDYKFKFKKDDRNKILVVDLHPEAFAALPKQILEIAEIQTHQLFNLNDLKTETLRKFTPNFIKKFVKMSTLTKKIAEKVYKEFWFVELRQRAKMISPEDRLRIAEEKIKNIARSKLVITSRLHAALPAVAFGIPVIFVHENLKDSRFEGLLQFMNAYTVEDFKIEVDNIDFENPPQNPNREELNKIKRELIKRVQDFTEG